MATTADEYYRILKLYLGVLWEVIMYTYERFTYPKNYAERNIRGAIAIVTGANSGIGKATAFQLAKRGATVVLGCRNLTEGRKVIDEMERANVSGKFDLIELDLADLSSVRQFASSVKVKYTKVDILVNNAGIFDTSGIWKKTKDGFETHFGVNHLGHFYLANLLLDQIRKGNSSRVINVSSSLQRFASPYFDLNDLMLKKPKEKVLFNALPYGLSKYSNSLFSKELNRRLEGSGAISCSVCPGYVDTGLFRHSSMTQRIIVFLTVQLLGLSVYQGCETTIFLATSSTPPSGGKFYRMNQIHKAINYQLSDSIASELWQKSAKLVGLE